MIRKLSLTILVGLALAGCEMEPRFDLSTATMNCNHGSCRLTFNVTNRSDAALPLIYDILLSQNHIRDPSKSKLIIVGEADGAIDLQPNEAKKIEVDIEVTESPNGSKVSVFDSRTPEVILEILDF